MLNRLLTYLKNLDWIMAAAVVVLLSFGLLELYSIALSKGGIDLLNFKKQIFFVVFGLLTMLAAAMFDYHNWLGFGKHLYLGGLLLLVLVLVFGKTVRGTTGWFDFGQFSLQPVEFVKIALIIYLAGYFARYKTELKPWRHLIVSGASMGLLAGLVIIQPDFGSAMLLLLIWGGLVLSAGFRYKYIAAIMLILAMAAVFSWFFLFADYQKERVLTFVAPKRADPETSYNINQAIIAVGSGGMTGRGVGFGSQSQLKFLPEAQNDFIFAVISEELGFLGAGLVLAFFAVLFYRLLMAARDSNNDFATYFLIGAMLLIFSEMFINIGMNIGLLPVIGISLPFISYGGSAILSTLIIVGIAQSMIIRNKIKY